MTFTYNTPFQTDVDRARFHLGDTDAGLPRMSDEEIQGVIDESASWKHAVISCIVSMIARLSQPNFTADWLTVNHAAARAGYETLLGLKRAEFGISGRQALTASVVHVSRADLPARADDDGVVDYGMCW